ncbi:hypothetical protein COCNU_01G016470 [Cocos nucifera]|uniref:Uncharacterized protein n=1 Tax=Cocos nucifera TaxID=13894 RepID=A0A8K0HWT8_COCNU|nr:hypothetical protein COCNU_01G016470 [Cocos nucifera]
MRVQLMHDITIKHEGLTSFSQLSHSLKEKTQIVEAWDEVAKEREAKRIKERAWIDADLVAIQEKVAECEAHLAKEKKTIVELEKEINLCEPALAALEEKKIATVEAARVAEDKAVAAKATAQDAIARAISDFKDSQEFAKEVTEGLVKDCQLGFDDCRTQVALLFPHLVLSKLGSTNEAEEGLEASLEQPVLEPEPEPIEETKPIMDTKPPSTAHVEVAGASIEA